MLHVSYHKQGNNKYRKKIIQKNNKSKLKQDKLRCVHLTFSNCSMLNPS